LAGPAARIGRLDRDSARRPGAAEETLQKVHAGELDLLVGTQMIAKGHDFQGVSVVCVLNADAQLIAADFRAPERLFALLMQVAGRAGRAGQARGSWCRPAFRTTRCTELWRWATMDNSHTSSWPSGVPHGCRHSRTTRC